MKRAAAVLLILAMVCSLCACAQKGSGDAQDEAGGSTIENAGGTGESGSGSAEVVTAGAESSEEAKDSEQVKDSDAGTSGADASEKVEEAKKDSLKGYLNLVNNYNLEGISNPEILDAPKAKAQEVIDDVYASQEEVDAALAELKSAFGKLGDSSDLARVNTLEAMEGWPDPYEFLDGSSVESAEDWPARAEELSEMYQYYMYGYWREGEQVSYSLSDSGATVFNGFGTSAAPDAVNMTITVEQKGKTTSWSVPVYLPDESKAAMPEGGWPFIVCMHDIAPRQTALDNGYAVIVLNTYEIASDNIAHTGCFYDLYPYTDNLDDQTGVLMAWSWSASKVLDALYAGAGAELGINPDNSIVTGVSRWGKATAVCGAFEKRFKMVAPSCSGAGGLALYRYMSEGNTYDFSSKGASDSYTYGTNEPLSSLQSSSERGWFNDNFTSFDSAEYIPLEQYELAALCADENRYYFIIGSCISEDWVNAPSMWACYKAAHSIYDYLGLGDHIVCNIHKEGHAVIEEDMQYMIAYFNKMVYGIEPDASVDLTAITTSVFELEANYDPIFDSIAAGWEK